MVMLVGMITTLLLGFLLGRIWQIRQEILLAEQVHKRQHAAEWSVAIEASRQSPATDSKPSVLSDRRNAGLLRAPVPAVRFRGGSIASPGRFRALHQSLQHVGGSVL
jgi:hypothetical protein